MTHCISCGARFYPGNFNLETAKVCRDCRPAVKRERERQRRHGVAGLTVEQLVGLLRDRGELPPPHERS